MQQNEIKISPNFKRMAVKAMLSIVLFLLVYLILFALAIGITLVCGYLGIMLIVFKPAIYTLLIGFGMISIGILVIIFLLKFMFKKHKIDRSHLTELTRGQQPQLFDFIQEIVSDVKTGFPKKIYLSADVNAAVFYDSNFWSMFFPVKKNLQIGMGLVNSVSAIEFKAILAHEFGHFSQRTMKVGSYVYNVNQVIYNLLYDNKSFQSLAQRWANVSGYVSFFVMIAVRLVQGIQWVLRKIYTVINLNYMGLSREMEFHADAVAAGVTGSQPLISSLLRLDLSGSSYHTVLNYYNDKIGDAVKTKNIYPQHHLVMNFLARESKLAIENDLPQVSLQHVNKYNKSKLVIKDQWASHPSTIDRVTELKKLTDKTMEDDQRLASALFSDIDALQAEMTKTLFAGIDYGEKECYANEEQFISEFTTTHQTNSFNDIYNAYYDNKSPTQIDTAMPPGDTRFAGQSISHFYNDDAVDMVYSSIALENDLSVLSQLSKGGHEIKTFDYDGEKFAWSEAVLLIPRLEKDLADLKENLHQNDIGIFQYFYALAAMSGEEQELVDRYQYFFLIDREYTRKIHFLTTVVQGTQFIHESHAYSDIDNNLDGLKKVEKDFKIEIEELLLNKMYQPAITFAIKDNFKNYLARNHTYFKMPSYNDEALKILFNAMKDFQLVMSQTYLAIKRELLNFQARLEQS